MPDENRGPWSKKFENRCCSVDCRLFSVASVVI